MAVPLVVRVRQELVVRESDGRTLLLIHAYCGEHDEPVFVQVVEQPEFDGEDDMSHGDITGL